MDQVHCKNWGVEVAPRCQISRYYIDTRVVVYHPVSVQVLVAFTATLLGCQNIMLLIIIIIIIIVKVRVQYYESSIVWRLQACHRVQELFPVLVWEICGNLTGDGMDQGSNHPNI